MPDICGKIENPKEGSQSRDKKWISENLIDFESMVYGHKLMPYQQLCPSRCIVSKKLKHQWPKSETKSGRVQTN